MDQKKGNSVFSQSLPREEELSAQLRSRYLLATYQYLEEPPVKVSLRDVERSFLACIALGNDVLLLRQIDAIKHHRIEIVVGKLSETPVLQEQFAAVATITLYCRTAIDGGMPEHLAYRISDTYIQYIGTNKSVPEIIQLVFDAALEYCRVMQDWRLRECRPAVKKCCEYVLVHLHERITLEALARVAHLSPNHLSALFVEQLGRRPSVYIREQKLNYARYILELYDMPISTLSNLLAFPSASAFAQQFKRLYGVTPREFQNRVR